MNNITNNKNDVRRLETLQDYKDAGVFYTMPNGFDIFDYDTDEDITGRYTGLMDCVVRLIAPSPNDSCCVAFYVDTSNFKPDEVIECPADTLGFYDFPDDEDYHCREFNDIP